MLASDGPPKWYRGPDDPSGYRVKVCDDLRHMRVRMAKLTQQELARVLGRLLHRNIPETYGLTTDSIAIGTGRV